MLTKKYLFYIFIIEVTVPSQGSGRYVFVC